MVLGGSSENSSQPFTYFIVLAGFKVVAIGFLTSFFMYGLLSQQVSLSSTPSGTLKPTLLYEMSSFLRFGNFDLSKSACTGTSTPGLKNRSLRSIFLSMGFLKPMLQLSSINTSTLFGMKSS